VKILKMKIPTNSEETGTAPAKYPTPGGEGTGFHSCSKMFTVRSNMARHLVMAEDITK